MQTDRFDERFKASEVFKLRGCWQHNAVLPFSLSIVDCYFIFAAFASNREGATGINLERISNGGAEREHLLVGDAFALYAAFRDAEGREVLFVEPTSRASVYLDEHERFTLIDGPDSFLSTAIPYPREVEQHRYVESMLHLEDAEYPVAPEQVFLRLTRADRDGL